MTQATTRCGLIILLAAVLSACATTKYTDSELSSTVAPQPATTSLELVSRAMPRPLTEVTERPREKVTLIPGTGNFINTRAATRPVTRSFAKGEVTLNFEAADLREVVKVVFDTLGENYIIDPQVQGVVTIQTSRPVPKQTLLSTLDTLLQMNGATMVQAEGVYRIIPLSNAVAGNASPRLGQARLNPGFNIRVVPLRYVSATEMEKMLTPFAPQGSILNVDPGRNIVTLSGTENELAVLQETIDIFDVNWMQGMSFGIFRLQNVDSQTMAENLSKLFGEDSKMPMAGMLRFIPVNQLNSVVVITPQIAYLQEIGKWVERLDGAGGERLYVYPVQNGSAEYLAEVLNQLFGSGGGGGGMGGVPARTAPGLRPTSPTSPAPTGSSSPFAGQVLPSTRQTSPFTDQTGSSGLGGTSGVGGTSGLGSGTRGTGATQGLGESQQPAAPRSVSLGLGSEEVRVIADTENNALVIWSSARNYEKIMDALRKLDVTARQVLVEATIAEVVLSGDLQFGLRWWFQGGVGGYTSTASLRQRQTLKLEDLSNIAEGATASALDGGFSYVISNGGDRIVKLLLTALASESKVNVLSAPSVMVVDNQEANIRVGDQIPIQTGTTLTTGGNETTSIQYKDTGVLLQVRPQVNAGGLVTMDINQEVTNVGPKTTIGNAGEQFTFLQRSVRSKVTVKSGETLVLGGLIQDRGTNSRDGVPILYKLPVLGWFFGARSNSTNRTELLVLITPRVIETQQDKQRALEDLKRRLRESAPLLDRLG